VETIVEDDVIAEIPVASSTKEQAPGAPGATTLTAGGGMTAIVVIAAAETMIEIGGDDETRVIPDRDPDADAERDAKTCS